MTVQDALAMAERERLSPGRVSVCTDIAVVPWQDRTLIEAAVDLTGEIRDELPGEVIMRLSKLPTQTLAALTVVLAAMVDADRPLSALKRWELPGFMGARPIAENAAANSGRRPYCVRGHLLDAFNARYEDVGAPRCRTCDRERKRRTKPDV